MKTFRNLIATLAILSGLGCAVFAEKQGDLHPSQEEKQFIVSFHENVTATEFNGSVKWITDNGGEILITMDDDQDKLLLVKMTDHIRNITGKQVSQRSFLPVSFRRAC
jgi:hypothetical protein